MDTITSVPQVGAIIYEPLRQMGKCNFSCICVSNPCAYKRIAQLHTDLDAANKEVERLKKESKAQKQEQWAALNTARCVLLNRIEDLTALAEDIRLQELKIKQALRPALPERKEE